jgi:hypothetical protein
LVLVRWEVPRRDKSERRRERGIEGEEDREKEGEEEG